MGEQFSARILASAFCLSLGSFSFGYHVGVLNSPKQVIISCPAGGDCIPMSENTFAWITAAMNLGALPGSLFSGSLQNRIGRHLALLLSTFCFITGAICMGLTHRVDVFLTGRVLTGIASGMALSIVPIWLMDIAPTGHRGAFGGLNQLGIVVGITVAQLMGLFLSTPLLWRYILLFPIIVSFTHLALLPLVPPSTQANQASQASQTSQASQEEPLIPSERKNWRFLQVLKTPAALKGVLLGLCFQCLQQFSGVNALVYYSTSIFERLFPSAASLVTFIMSLVNLLSTFLNFLLLDWLGFRKVLCISALASSLAMSSLALGLFLDWAYLSAVSVVVFMGVFAIGLGPVPFLIIPDLVPEQAIPVAQSISLCANWSSTFLIAGLFFSAANLLGSGVWLLFAAACVIMAWLSWNVLPDHSHHHQQQQWQSIEDEDGVDDEA